MLRSVTAFISPSRPRPRPPAAGWRLRLLAGAVVLASLVPAASPTIADDAPPAALTVAVAAEGPAVLGDAELFRMGTGVADLTAVDVERGRAALDGDTVLYQPAPSTVEDRLRLRRGTAAGGAFEATVRVVVRPETVPVNGVWRRGGAVEQGWFEASTSTFVLCAGGGLASCERRRLPVGGPGWSPFVARLAAGAPSTLGVHDPASGRLFLRRRGLMSTVLGPVGAQAIAADTDGDGVDEIGFFDAPSGVVYWVDGGATEAPDASPSALAVVGDWDDDGRESVGVYDRASGRFTVTGHGLEASGRLDAGLWPVRWGHAVDGDGGNVVGFYDPRGDLLRFVLGPSLLLKDGCGPDGLCWADWPEEHYVPPPTDPPNDIDCIGGDCRPGHG
ncbi:MAG: hypothetical protein AAGF23_03135 [Acidobacteriota bacterium]